MEETKTSVEDAMRELERAMSSMSGNETEYVLVLDAYDLLEEALQRWGGR